MSEHARDLKPRTKTFALRIIKMYSALPKADSIAQVLGKQVFGQGLLLEQTTAKHRAVAQRPNSFRKSVIALRKSKKPSIGSNCWWIAAVFPIRKCATFLMKRGN